MDLYRLLLVRCCLPTKTASPTRGCRPCTPYGNSFVMWNLTNAEISTGLWWTTSPNVLSFPYFRFHFPFFVSETMMHVIFEMTAKVNRQRPNGEADRQWEVLHPWPSRSDIMISSTWPKPVKGPKVFPFSRNALIRRQVNVVNFKLTNSLFPNPVEEGLGKFKFSIKKHGLAECRHDLLNVPEEIALRNYRLRLPAILDFRAFTF